MVGINLGNKILYLILLISMIHGFSSVCYGNGNWIDIMQEDFEGSFPSQGWQLKGSPTWDEDDYNPHTGSYSAWCAGSSLDPEQSNYANDMWAEMIYGPFDLSDASEAKLTFYYWNNSENSFDYLNWLASSNGVNFYGESVDGDSGGWVYEEFDLTNVPVIGDVCGDSSVWIAFVFSSDARNTYKGAFIDDVILKKKGLPAPSIDIEKYTNNENADDPPGPDILVGDPVKWDYLIMNTGNATLTDIAVTDNQGLTVDCPKTTLEPGESMMCTVNGTAEAGQYSNVGTVTGKYDGKTYRDSDSSHYFGVDISVDIEKHTNNRDADDPPGPSVRVGSRVKWEYIITNTGNVILSNIAVTDDQGVTIDCPSDTLRPGRSMKCTATDVATLGQYSNMGTVVGEYNGKTCSDTDPSHYLGIEKGWERAYQVIFEDPDDLELMRNYRDEFLSKTPRGRRYIKIIYENSDEFLQVLLDNPDLMIKARELVKSNKEAVRKALNGKENANCDTDEVISFLNAYAAKSPPKLRILVLIIKGKILESRRKDKPFFGFTFR
jgi:hypothetical protein